MIIFSSVFFYCFTKHVSVWACEALGVCLDSWVSFTEKAHTKLTCYLKVHDILNTAFLQVYEIYKVANEQAFYFDTMLLWENSIENN